MTAFPLYHAPLTHEKWVNGAWYKSLFGAPPPANPVRNTKSPNDWKSQSFGLLVLRHAQPTIDKQIRAIDVLAGVRTEQQRRADQVIGPAQPPDRDPRFHLGTMFGV